MNRSTLAAIAALLVVVVLIGASWAGHAAALTLQQSEPLDVNVWLSQIDSTDPVRRLDPGTSSAQIVVQSNLRDTDPNRFRAEVWDATGIRVYQSATLQLPIGSYTETIVITGTTAFNAYSSYVDSEATALQDAVADAVAEANKTDPGAAQVRSLIQDVLAVEDRLSNGVGRMRAFDLSADGGADAAFAAAETDLTTVSDRGSEAVDLLEADPINWDDVRAKLHAMETAAADAATRIDTGLAAVNPGAERSFPVTGVTGRCNQNAAQLRVAGSDSVTDDFWWTVGTPGAPARLTNAEQPTAVGQLRAFRAQMYATSVDVAGVPHSATVEALALDDLCVPVPGATVNFSTPADSIVVVQTPQVTTDANGVAQATIDATGEIGNGTATVNATVDSATASVGLTVIGPPALLNLRLGGSEVERIPNYGVESTVQVGAVVKDANGNDVADGTPAQFSINPPDHSFTDSGPVITSGGQASATLVLGSATGTYTIEAQSGSAQDVQQIRVVGNPSQIQVEPDRNMVKVNTLNVDNRTIQLTVTVKDSEGQWAPDGTMVEFEFVNPDDADWAFFNFQPDNLGRYRKPIINGQTVAPLVGSPTNLSNPDQMMSGQREVAVRATATYTVSGEERASVSQDITVVFQGQMVFLPLIRR